MSHFAVLVIGENPEKQLALYHEFECTGENDEFVQDVDITADEKKVTRYDMEHFGDTAGGCDMVEWESGDWVKYEDVLPALEALNMFVQQWNACGPNSDFGRYFMSVRNAAVSAIAKAKCQP